MWICFVLWVRIGSWSAFLLPDPPKLTVETVKCLVLDEPSEPFQDTSCILVGRQLFEIKTANRKLFRKSEKCWELIKREMSADSRAQWLFQQDRSASGEIHESKLLESNQQSLLSQQTCYFILNVTISKYGKVQWGSSPSDSDFLSLVCLFGLQKTKQQKLEINCLHIFSPSVIINLFNLLFYVGLANDLRRSATEFFVVLSAIKHFFFKMLFEKEKSYLEDTCLNVLASLR